MLKMSTQFRFSPKYLPAHAATESNAALLSARVATLAVPSISPRPNRAIIVNTGWMEISSSDGYKCSRRIPQTHACRRINSLTFAAVRKRDSISCWGLNWIPAPLYFHSSLCLKQNEKRKMSGACEQICGNILFCFLIFAKTQLPVWPNPFHPQLKSIMPLFAKT